MQASFPPFFFELDLHAAVDSDTSRATVKPGLITFELVKSTPGVWHRLQTQAETADKETLRQRRAASQNRLLVRQQQAEVARQEEKQEAQRASVRAQMDLDARQRQQLEDLKTAEKEAVQHELASMGALPPAAASQPQASEQVNLAPLRSSASIKVAFTPRAFATPSRESFAREEEEWLAKQAHARKAVQRATEANPTDVEADPLWLRDRGQEFFRLGNFQSAINAFTSAITLAPNLPALYSNRAACHLQLKDYHACAADSSKALTLLLPPVPANAKARVKALSRRAAALTFLEDYEAALQDVLAALEIEPGNAGLQDDRCRLESRVPSQSAAL